VHWTSDHARLARAGVLDELQAYRIKPEIALAEIDRVHRYQLRYRRIYRPVASMRLQPSRPKPFNTVAALLSPLSCQSSQAMTALLQRRSGPG
jgi:hypothetical protein